MITYIIHKIREIATAIAPGASKKARHTRTAKISSKESRFIRFASVEHDGQLYMSPRDFLEAVTQAGARQISERNVLSDKGLEEITQTIAVANGSPKLFRELGTRGIISYKDYLFLLSILIKPQSGFRIAFNMLDTNNDQKVDKEEFLVMKRIFCQTRKAKSGLCNNDNDEECLQKKRTVETTLSVYLFGPQGNYDLSFERFEKFMIDLQREVVEVEFAEYSGGSQTISEFDFAKILLKYTRLHPREHQVYLDRLSNRIKNTKGITIEDFYIFCQFLNNFEDFVIAMRVYIRAGQALSKDQLLRAVKVCTGKSVSRHLVHTVFAIFNENNDGLLSHREFVVRMKTRISRGVKSYESKGWKAFGLCMNDERSQIGLKTVKQHY